VAVMTADGRVWRIWRQVHRGGSGSGGGGGEQGASLLDDMWYGAMVGLSSPLGMLTIVTLLTLLINLVQGGGNQGGEPARERRGPGPAQPMRPAAVGAPADANTPAVRPSAHNSDDERGEKPTRGLSEALRRKQQDAAAREAAAAARAAAASASQEIPPPASSGRHAGAAWDPGHPPSDRTIAGGRDALFGLVSSFGGDGEGGSGGAVVPTLLMADRQTMAWALGIQAFTPQWLFVVLLPTPAVGGTATCQRDADLCLSPAAKRTLTDLHAAWPQLAAAAGVGSAELAAFPLLWVCADETATTAHASGSGECVPVALGRKAPIVTYHRQWSRLITRRLQRTTHTTAAATDVADDSADGDAGVEASSGAGGPLQCGGFACVRVQPDIGSAAIAALPFSALDDGRSGGGDAASRGGVLAGWLLSVQAGNVPVRDASDAVMALVA